MSGSHAEGRRERRLAHPIRWAVLVVVVVLVGVVAWIGIRGWLASEHLKKAVPLADEVQSQVLDGDGAGALATAETLQHEVHAARDLTGDVIWRGAELLPFAGDDLRAVRQVSEALTGVADDAIVPVSTIASTVGVDAFKPVDGAIDLQPLIEARPAVDKADRALKRELTRASSIDASGTVGPIRDAVGQLVDVLTKASGQVDTVARAVDLAPAMLGADDPRDYLVLFQNNAELRATGGIPGAAALLHAENGRLSLVQQASSGDFPRADQPVLPLPIETEGLYGRITGQYIQDVNLTPQFPLSAKLAAEMWKRQFGTSVDGVLSIDPVALSYLLTATGPITLPTGDVISSDNVVSLLLNDVYKRYSDPDDQDLFFEGTAAGVFSSVSSGALDPTALVAALAKAGEERRVYLWSADADEQSRIAETTLAGELPTSTPEQPRFGVYLNDGTGAKMDYYLDATFGVGQTVCRQDGLPTYVVEVTLRNDAPADAATSLPEYVTGGGAFGVPPGLVSTNVSIYAPKSGVFVTAVQDGKETPLQTATDAGLSVAQFQTTLSPGQSTTWRLQFLGGAAGGGTPVLEKTPLVHQTETKGLNISCESPLT